MKQPDPKYNFDTVKKQLANIPDIQGKMLCLYEWKNMFSQQYPFRPGPESQVYDRVFERQCYNEMDKLREVQGVMKYSDPERIRLLKIRLLGAGLNPENAELMENVSQSYWNGEITDEEYDNAIESFAQIYREKRQDKEVPGYKYHSKILKRLGELLAESDYIRKQDVERFSLMQGGMQWRKEKKTPRLIYLVREIRSDGKRPWAEMSRLFGIELSRNTRVQGYSEIDDLIKKATE